jgi:hypothetical protein
MNFSNDFKVNFQNIILKDKKNGAFLRKYYRSPFSTRIDEFFRFG